MLRILLVLLLLGGATGVYVIRSLPPGPYTEQRFILDTSVTVTIHDKDRGLAARAADAALDEMERVGTVADHRTKGTPLAKLNHSLETSTSGDVSDSDLRQMIAGGLQMAKMTTGAFDPTIEPLVRLWGIGVSDHLPSANEVAGWKKLVDYEGFEIIDDTDGTAGRVMLHGRKGASFDLGGLSKGYAADRAKDVLERMGVDGALVTSVSSTSIMGKKSDGSPWTVAIENPRADKGPEIIAELAVPPGYHVSTSGDYQRFFIRDGQRYHHILSPRTGWPSNMNMSVTVVTKKGGMIADMLSTSMFILDQRKALELLHNYGGGAVVFVLPDGNVQVGGSEVDKIVTRAIRSVKGPK